MSRRNAIGRIFFLIVIFLIGGSYFLYFRKRRKLRKPYEYAETISEISEIIIPQTSTPGAKEAGVHTYIVNVIENCLQERDKRIVLEGLYDVDEYSVKKYSLFFAECSNEKKISVLKHFENKGSFDNAFLNKVKRKIIGPTFFELMKDLTVNGYCMSETGATRGLAYEHVPINYVACMPMFPNQKSWATA